MMTKDKLALYGGKPVFDEPINHSQHLITKDDKDAVLSCLDSDWLAGRSAIVHEFEQQIAKYTGYNYAIAVNSATSGLFTVLLHARMNNGNDEPIVIPSLTFVATLNAPLLAGFNSVKIVDVNPNTFLLDSDTLTFEQSDWSIPVSYAGYPYESARGHLVIDAAHQLAKKRNYIPHWAVSVISTHAIKPLTTGEGGVILCNDKKLADEFRQLSDHGNGGGLYGHNFRMSSVQAALGLSQLQRADEMFAIRREIAAIYRNTLKDMPVKMQDNHPSHSNHIFPIILDEGIGRNWFRDALLAEGVKTQIHYEPLHLLAKRHGMSHKIRTNGEYPVSESMWNHGFSLPIHNAMTLKEARMVMVAFEKIINSLGNQ